MDNNDILASVGRLRRAIVDVVAVCDGLERALRGGAVTLPIEPAVGPQEKPRFDRRAYQRELMRKRRAEGRA